MNLATPPRTPVAGTPVYGTPTKNYGTPTKPSEPQRNKYGFLPMGISQQSFKPRQTFKNRPIKNETLPKNLMETRVLGAYNTKTNTGWLETSKGIERFPQKINAYGMRKYNTKKSRKLRKSRKTRQN